MDSQTIDGLYALAIGSGLPAFFTHGWYDDESDPLNADTGVWKSPRIESGNLFADWHAFDTPHRAGIFSRAKVDPNSIAVSPIFDYKLREGSTTLCNPTRFISADFVKSGAINKALFSDQTQNTEPMDISELIEALKDEKVQSAVLAIIKAHKADASSDEPAAAEMEKDSGVTDADKKPEDEQKPALMRAFVQCNRANIRVIKSLAIDETALLAKAKVEAAAEATALLGKGNFLKAGSDVTAGTEIESAIAAQIAAGAKDRATAIFRVAKDKPETYNTARAAGKI